MKKMLVLVFIFSLYYISSANAAEVKQGDIVKIIVPGTMARLCPYANCGQDAHIGRIPEGVELEIEGIIDVKGGGTMKWAVKWFEVTYKGKRGWISIYNTDAQ